MSEDRNSSSSADKNEKVGRREQPAPTKEEVLNRPGIQEVLSVHQGWRADTRETK